MTEDASRPHLQTATFAAGCFWGVEQAFREVPGVAETAVGYMGGSLAHPTYEDVCSGKTGHSEAVQVTFDPSKVSYEDLLEVFWSIHDPTYKAKVQYQSAVFYHTEEQRATAQEALTKAAASHRFSGAITTKVLPAGPFWRAEEYHQRYLERRGGTC